MSRFTNRVLRACVALALISAVAMSWTAPFMQSAVSAADKNAAKPVSAVPSKDALKWADKQLKQMTVDEKIGQLLSVGINASFLNQESDAYKTLRHHIEDNNVGGIILFRGPVYESVHIVNRMQALAKYPLLISADLEAGAGMRFDDTVNFPWNMAVGATGNPEYARRQGEITAHEARALGVQQVYAPVADVNNNAANPVINVRSYGEDPAEVGRFVAAFVEGTQRNGVLATAKHFPGHGDTAIDSHRGLPIIDLPASRLESVELVPFRAAIKAGVGAIMSAHIGLPQLDGETVVPLKREDARKSEDAETEVSTARATMPATLSSRVLDGMLRKQLGFEGVIVTDALSMAGLTIYFRQDEIAVRALLAGADLLLKPADVDAATRGLREAVKSGRVTEERLNVSVRKVLALKYDLGLVKQRITPLDTVDTAVGKRDVSDLAREIAEHAITLVRNDASLVSLANLPRDAKVFNLAITNGDDRLFIANPFSSAMARGGRRAETVVLDDRSSDADVAAAIEQASRATVVIASLYGRVRTGQARSVGIPDSGARALNALIERKAPVIGISFGNPYLLQSFPGLQTYMVAYGDMPSLQQAAARALLGEIDVTGRLPISLPGLYPRGTGIQLKAAAAR